MNNDINLLKTKNDFLRYKNVNTMVLFENTNYSVSPLISIVIPTYQRVCELKEAILSAVNQKDCSLDYEIVILDNKSSSECSDEIINFLAHKDFQHVSIKYYQNDENIGMFGNWNRCIELARGEWVSFLHDDDLLHKDYLNRVLRLITSDLKIDGICSNVEYFGSKSKWKKTNLVFTKSIKEYANSFLTNRLVEIKIMDSIFLNSNPYGEPSCGLILRKSHILNLGGFDESYGAVADWFFLFKFNNDYKIYKPFFVTGYYRWEVNESMKPITIHEFFNGFEIMRKFGSNYCKLGRFLYKTFKQEQHTLKITELESLIESSGLDKNSFNYICIYKKRILKFAFYKSMSKFYKKIKKIINLV
ncbi:glycosyltransferase family 2 protein [Alkaliphilus peptidifermentans]|nr:glycosyltransferase family 2 protein [Alkaliphilus peptidifermentans]